MSPSFSLSKVGLIVVVLSSLVCTASTILRPLLGFHLHRRKSKRSHIRSGNKNRNNPYLWQTNRMVPSPQPSQLTRQSGDTFLAWSSPSKVGHSDAFASSACLITLLQAALDHLSQLIFLAIVMSTLLRSGKEEPLDLLHHRGALFICAFVFSLRLLLPLSFTLYSAAIGLRQQHTNGTLFTIVPALLFALLGAVFTLVASIFRSQVAACILLLSIVGLCLGLNTFIALRLIVIQRRSTFGQAPSSIQHPLKGKQAILNDNKEGYLASTTSTAGTKASSANPYDTRCKNKLVNEVDKSIIEEEEENCDILESKYSTATAANDSKEISSLWLNQSVPLQTSDDVVHTYHQGTFDDEILLTPPPSASFRSLEPISPANAGMDRGGGRLRISPSAREIMVSLSTPLDFYEPAISLDLHSISIGLAGMWIISILCIPLLVASIIYTQPTLSTQILTLCFIIGMAVTGPLLALKTFKVGKYNTSLPSTHCLSTSPLPRPSFASSLITGRTSKASNYSLSHRECPVAGDGFEPVNGYDYPFSAYLPGSYESDKRVKSVAYLSCHWNSAAIAGDRVMASQGVLGRAANMMSPKPKLQVLSPSRNGKSSNETVTSQMSCKISLGFDELGLTNQSADAIVQDISETSAIMPGAMPFSPEQGDNYHSSRSMQCERRIDTIYELDASTHNSEDGSPGMPRGISKFTASPFHRLTTALRKRRATLSEADWVNVSPFSIRDGRQHSIQYESASVSSHSLSVHRSSLSMSVVQHQTDWFEGDTHEMASIPDASRSDAEMGDMSICSYYSMPPSDADFTATTDISTVSQGTEEPCLEEEYRRESEQEEGGKEVESIHAKEKGEDDESISRNWKIIGSPSILETSPVAQRDIDMSLASSRSLANVMGISDGDAVVVDQSTPIRRGVRLSSSFNLSKEASQKSLCSEMGFTVPSPAQESSPCRTSSDLSSLHHRRMMTADTISDSFLSSGVDEELIISPDVTPERIGGDSEREIIVVEMDESLPMGSGSGDIGSDQDEQVETPVYPFSTQRYYQEGGNYLDPVEEVTEEPTIPISEHEDSNNWVYSDSVEEKKYSESLYQDTYVDSPDSKTRHKVTDQQVTSSTPVLSRNVAEEWARLHGFATPSSFAYSPQSQFGWAEVIETGKRTQMSIQRRSHRSPYSPPLTLSPPARSRIDSNLSAQTRAYLASRLSGTPSRLIGLQSKFWLSSPPSLALDANAFLKSSGKRVGRSSLMIAMSPSVGFEEDPSWVDGAIAEEEELMAQREMEQCARNWKRKSKNIAGAEGKGPSFNIKTTTGRHRSSASLQSLIDAAVKRSSGAFRRSIQQSRVTSSNRSSLASQMTIPSIIVSTESGNRASQGSRSDIKVVGTVVSSPPSTPRRRSISNQEVTEYASGKAPSKSGGSGKSRDSKPEFESPSSGKGIMTVLALSGSPNRGSPASRGKRTSANGRVNHKVHNRKESRVRETIKMLEFSLRADTNQHQTTANALQAISPRKKVKVLPASPGKFRLQEAAAADTDEGDKENIATAPLLKRISRTSRFNLRRPHPPQIFVRPPSGSSTHTQHLY